MYIYIKLTSRFIEKRLQEEKRNGSCEYICPPLNQRDNGVLKDCYQPDLLLGNDWGAKKVTIYFPIFYLVKSSENILFFDLHLI